MIVPRFGGLDLGGDPQEIGFNGAIDLSNVDFDRTGRMRTRDGFVHVTPDEGTNRYDSLFFMPAGSPFTRRILAGAGTRLEAIDPSDGSIAHSSTAPTQALHRFAAISSSVPAVYIANGVDQIRKYTTGGGFTAPAGLSTVTGKFLAVQTPDNRLVSAKGDRVSFSNANDPETFGADDWVDITPGDGESITGMVSWGGRLFVFKDTKFAVFTGNSTDSTGGTIFGYYVVDAGAGLSTYAGSLKGCVSTPVGVYFADARGLWRTTGDIPVYASRPVEALFRYEQVDVFPSEFGITEVPDMTYHNGRIYMCCKRDPDDYIMLVHDIDDGWWSYWPVSAQALTAMPGSAVVQPGLEDGVLFAFATGGKVIGRFASTATLDEDLDDGPGTVHIPWTYQTGFSDFGSDRVKTLNSVTVWGQGAVVVKVAVDHQDTDTGGAVTVDPSKRRGRQTTTRSGTFFSVRFEGLSTASLYRFEADVREQRARGVG